MKKNTLKLTQISIMTAIMCGAMHVSSTASAIAPANSSAKEEAMVFNGDFFRIAEAPFWDAANTAILKDSGLSFEQADEGKILLTSQTPTTGFEDTSSHLMSKGYYKDKIVNFEFMLSKDASTDVLLMARYPVRLSLTKNTDQAFSAPGAVGMSWDEWNEDNPERAYEGQEPQTELVLKAGKWHTFEAYFRTPRHDQGHNKISNALIMSVSINGTQVQSNVLVDSPSQNATFHWEDVNGPLSFDAISGQTALRNVLVSRANFDKIEVPEVSGGQSNQSELVNLVEQGKTAFKNYGCAECHSVKANDASVKTGPNLHGLFTRDIRKRLVQNQEKHEYEVRADGNYLRRSIRNAEAELAIAESGNNKGNAYLPIMPRYNEQIVADKDISAIYSYLLTRNDFWKQGPMVRLESSKGPTEYDPMQDALQFIVQDRVRIQRGPLPEVSGRAIHVGNPSALHYSFDPRNLSVAKIWQGGFIEASGELTGRGGNGFEIGYQAVELSLGEFGGILRPYNSAGNLVDFSFKEPKFKDFERIKQSAYSTKSFEQRLREQDAKFNGYYRNSTEKLAPVTFFYEVSGNQIGITHEFTPEGKVRIEISGELAQGQSFAINPQMLKNVSVDKGLLENGVWKLSIADIKGEDNAAILIATITTVETPWKPEQIGYTYESQSLKSNEAEANLPPGYSIESWQAPKDNLGRDYLFEAIGLDTTTSGDILVSTRTAGVWKISDGKWQLMAEGMFDSLGILAEADNGSVAVVGNKAELTRLRDVNGDGFADYYDTVFDSFTNAGNYHTYTHGPTRDSNGDYVMTLNLGVGEGVYYTAGGNVMGSHGGYLGWAVRVSPTGKYEYFANGLRSPAGVGADLNGQVWYADNQGDFVGSSKIFMLEDDKFYGHPAGLIDEPDMTPDSSEVSWESVISRKEKAVIVVPHGKVANSLGNPAWDSTNGGFGHFAGQMLIGDQTQSNLTRVVTEQVNGQWQGAMIPFASGMESGVMRPHFLSDNSLLLGQTGRGWHAKGGNAAALQRIKYDGKTQHLHIKNVNITEDGFILSFTQALPQEFDGAAISKALSVNSWTYRDAQAYGSEEMGNQDDKIKSFVLSEDRKQLSIVLADPSIPQVHPEQTGRIYHIQLEADAFKAASGFASLDAYYSAHAFKSRLVTRGR